MQWLHELYQNILTFSNANPAIGGAITLTLSAAFAFMIKDIPSKVFKFIIEQSVTSLTMNNVPYTNSAIQFEYFGRWLSNNKWSMFSRTFTIESSYNSKVDAEGQSDFAIGVGTHFFLFQGKLFWCTRLNSSVPTGSNVPVVTIEISTFGRSVKPLKALFDDFSFKLPKTNIATYMWRNNDWVAMRSVQKRPLDTVIQKPEVINSLSFHIEDVLNNADWYHQRSFPCKKTIVIHGPPGTGKTSLVKAAATHYGLPLYLISLSMNYGDRLIEQLNSIPRPAIVLAEDVTDCKAILADSDSYHEITDRMLKKEERKQSSLESIHGEKSDDFAVGLTKSELLNLFDGVVPLEGLIFFLSSNYLSRIDPVFLRKGRVDADIYIGKLEHPEICRYLKMCFPGFDTDKQPEFKPIAGCDLRNLFIENRDSVHETVAAIRQFELEGV